MISPSWIFVAGAALAGAAGGWTANGWRLNGKIDTIEREAAEALAAERVAALDAYTRKDKELKAAGTRLDETAAQLAAQLEANRKERRNAPPLPTDCKPDAERVRSLERAVGAARAALGQRAR